jgi:hypothetical protein
MIAKIADKMGLILILISSALLGIWATLETIALRNILLGFGALASIIYLVNELKLMKQFQSKLTISASASIPLILIFIMLIWVVSHYFFFSTDHSRQWEELISTWLRAALAVLIGASTSIALSRNKNLLPTLWLGLFVSFLVLFYQYVPKALQRDSLFAVDHFGNYIYWAKFSGVLAGTVLIAGLLGMAIDYFLSSSKKEKDYLLVDWSDKKVGSLMLIYTLVGISLVTYSFVFVFDAKTGVGLAVILIGFWILIAFIVRGIQMLRRRNQTGGTVNSLKFNMILLLIVLIIGFLSYKHVKNNPGWESLLEDIAISVEIDKYQNWQNPSKFGFPKRADGTLVAGNAYERVSWGVVGYKLIWTEPLGSGILRSFPDQVKKLVPGFNSAPYTHSGWIDLGLSFGVLGLILIPAALLVALAESVLIQSYPFRATTISLSLATLVLYGVGEYAFQHGIEILFYVSGLVGGLTLMSSVKPKSIGS